MRLAAKFGKKGPEASRLDLLVLAVRKWDLTETGTLRTMYVWNATDAWRPRT